MKLQMAKNSLFAILLRSPWWASLAIAAALSLLGGALLPAGYGVVGALATLPFVVVSALAARRQWHLPSAARVSETRAAVAALAWPAFAGLLEQAFARDGYEVKRAAAASAVDFELVRRGRRMLVSARRWKSARTGLEALRALQAAKEAKEASDAGDANDEAGAAGSAGATDALYIGLGEFTDQARAFAAQHRIAVWQAAELAQALRQLPLSTRPSR